jgi:hypothetical protein
MCGIIVLMMGTQAQLAQCPAGQKGVTPMNNQNSKPQHTAWILSSTLMKDINTGENYPLHTPSWQAMDGMPSPHDPSNWVVMQDGRANGWQIAIAENTDGDINQVWVLAIFVDAYTGNEIQALAWASTTDGWQAEATSYCL